VSFNNGEMIATVFDTVQLVSDAQEEYKRYSATLFQNGAFWEEDRSRNSFLYSDSSSQKLIEGLRQFRDDFVRHSEISQHLAHKLLVQSILVKYLEERRDEHGNGVFADGFFAQFDRSSNFCDAIRSGNIVSLFNTLSVHFNGKIFELNESERFILQRVDLSSLADFLDAEIDLHRQQYVMWRLYAFDYLPVELISRIYEEFIPERADAVYTPVHLARLMIDECMPLESPLDAYRVIDVSCGSGIFLVTAFKRLVQWWQKNHYERTNKIETPNSHILQSILQESIYGIDIEEDAIQLSVFSLSIALCDMLSPTEIWLNLKFDDLRDKNLYTGNFFAYVNHEGITKNFNLVIGNPPFEDKNKELAHFIEDFELTVSCEIPRNQIALLFLQQAMLFLQKDGLLSLVMPAGPLLYNNTVDYRRDFFSKYEIPQIIDLSALMPKGYLFERTVSTAVLFANNRIPKEDHNILHITVKRSKVAKERQYFEIDRYDMHYVPQEIAVSDSIIWKTNLWGGGQLYYLVKRLMESRSLGGYLEDRKRQAGWFYSEGYVSGKTNNNKKASHLTNKPMVEVDKFTEEGILEVTEELRETFTVTQETNRLVFSPPHLLIKETPGRKKFAIEYVEDYLVFKHQIIGIHAPWGQEGELKKIAHLLQKHHSLFKVFLLSFSSRAGVSRSLSTVLMKDFMALPFPKDVSVLELSTNEKIIIDDILEYGIEEYQYGETSLVNTRSVTQDQLLEFGETFCGSLNSIYKVGDKLFYPQQPYQTMSYICFPFSYAMRIDEPTVLRESLETDYDRLLRYERGVVTFQRVLKLYREDVVVLIKPKAQRL